MHGNNKDWVAKKKQLARRQEEFNERKNNSTHKLERIRVTKNGKVLTDYEIWPSLHYDNWTMAEKSLLQRIANYMERPTSPSKIYSKLVKGEKITSRHGSVYSLVPIHHH